jgi:hypothetical protein
LGSPPTASTSAAAPSQSDASVPTPQSLPTNTSAAQDHQPSPPPTSHHSRAATSTFPSHSGRATPKCTHHAHQSQKWLFDATATI